MSRNKIAFNGLLYVAVGSVLFASAQVGAVNVVVKDSATGEDTPCGNLVKLSTSPDNVTVTTDESCAYSPPPPADPAVSSPVAVDISGITVNAGSQSQTINISGRTGLTVTFPFSVVSVSTPSVGSARASGTSVIYTPPGSATADVNTTFYYTIKDNTGNQDTGSVTVFVKKTTAPDPGTTIPCTPTNELTCKGTIAVDKGNKKSNNRLALGHWDVWQFTYNKNFAAALSHTGEPKKAVISTNPNASLSNPVNGHANCLYEDWAPEEPIRINTTTVSGSCPLEDGKTYYLKTRLYRNAGEPFAKDDPGYILSVNVKAQ